MASILAQGMTKAVSALCMKVATGVGADANNDMTVAGITTNDTIIGLFECTVATGDWVDHTATATINDDDDIRSSVAFAGTTNDRFICFWHDASA